MTYTEEEVKQMLSSINEVTMELAKNGLFTTNIMPTYEIYKESILKDRDK